MRLIDADALERVLDITPCADIKNIDGQAYVLVRLSQVFNIVKNAPTIEPEQKTGKWIGADSQCGIGCPFCGTPVDDFCSSIDYIDLNYEPNFCPNCGAKMEGLYESD